MIVKILDFCIRERLVILTASVALIAYGWHALQTVPLDAIPNVGENQVIVLSEWSGRSPKDVEDQITYPLSVALQAVPGSQSVRCRPAGHGCRGWLLKACSSGRHLATQPGGGRGGWGRAVLLRWRRGSTRRSSRTRS